MLFKNNPVIHKKNYMHSVACSHPTTEPAMLNLVSLQLDTLGCLLKSLPVSILEVEEGAEHYNFVNYYTPDPDCGIEHYGSKESALNNYLEITFAWHSWDYKASRRSHDYRV
jgi:hypothetical protein